MPASLAVPQPATTALQFPEWQREYQEALFETNPERLPQRVMIAEFVLLKRLRAIAHNQAANRERQKIEDALSKLKNLSCKEDAA
jgi:5,10-methylenetetrahydrofolate reductase